MPDAVGEASCIQCLESLHACIQACGKAGNGNERQPEMETGNWKLNWKQKWKHNLKLEVWKWGKDWE